MIAVLLVGLELSERLESRGTHALLESIQFAPILCTKGIKFECVLKSPGDFAKMEF